MHNDLLVVDGMQYSGWSRERFEEWHDGGLSCVHVTCAIWETSREAMTELLEWRKRFAEHADLIVLATTVEEIRAAKREGKTAVLLGFQNTAPVEDTIELLEVFWDLGIRVIQLTYNTQNSVGTGCWEERDSGLSGYIGRNWIEEMNRLGILIDVSHCSERTCLDAIEHSSKPVAITHGNPLSVVGTDVELYKRNRSDEVLIALAEKGGVIGLSMYPRIAPGGEKCTLQDFCNAIIWTGELIGIDHVAIGSDFCLGMSPDRFIWFRTGRWGRVPAVPLTSETKFPVWIPNPSHFPVITQGLLDAGLSAEDVSRVMGGNFLRLFDEVFRTPVGDLAGPARGDAEGHE